MHIVFGGSHLLYQSVLNISQSHHFCTIQISFGSIVIFLHFIAFMLLSLFIYQMKINRTQQYPSKKKKAKKQDCLRNRQEQLLPIFFQIIFIHGEREREKVSVTKTAETYLLPFEKFRFSKVTLQPSFATFFYFPVPFSSFLVK